MTGRNWGLSIALFFVFIIQVYHLKHDFGPRGDLSAWGVAFAYMLAITVSYGAIFCLWCAARGPVKIVALLLIIPLFYYGDMVSVEASKRVFAMKKHKTFDSEKLGNLGAVKNNKMVAACQDPASQQCTDATAEFQEFKSDKSNENESASEKAMGGTAEDSQEKVTAMASRNAWGLEVINAILAILNALWMMEAGLISVQRNSLGLSDLLGGSSGKKSKGVAA